MTTTREVKIKRILDLFNEILAIDVDLVCTSDQGQVKQISIFCSTCQNNLCLPCVKRCFQQGHDLDFKRIGHDPFKCRSGFGTPINDGQRVQYRLEDISSN